MSHDFCRLLLKAEKEQNSRSIRAKISCKMPALHKAGDPQFEVLVVHVADPKTVLKREWVKACCAWYAKYDVLTRCHEFFTAAWYDAQKQATD